jgi:choline dehydrogenase-like flavoprotein
VPQQRPQRALKHAHPDCIMKHVSHDVVIVGSGPTGGYAAKALSEAGMRVLVLDAGRQPLHDKALLASDTLRRKFGYKIEEDPAAIRRQPIQSNCYAWPLHPHAFVDDTRNPFTTDADRPFWWIRTRHFGGRMVVRRHGLQFYRFSDLDFTAGERDGTGPAWPLSYENLRPYYERIERWLQVRGTVNNLPQLPDSVLSGERTLNRGEQVLSAAIERHLPDRTLIPGRTASPAIPIRDALATGKCTVRSNAVVSRLVAARSGERLEAVEFVDRRTRLAHSVRARVVVLCASAIESARLLLVSATPQHARGLANSSDTVGRYLMDHVHLTGAHATMSLDDPVPMPSWAYVPCFRNVRQADTRFLRGYGVQVFTMWRECALTVFGEMLPHVDNRVTLDPQRKDAYGVPVARISCVHRENDVAVAKDAREACNEMLAAAGFVPTRLNARLSPPGLACHEVGTIRMGRDPNTSALNSFCQSWDVRNLFVMDGSCFVSQGVQNPTLTMMAIAARSCDYLLDACRRGDLA